MAKRRRESENANPPGKRQKLAGKSSSKTEDEEISSVKQLQKLLAFNQDASTTARQSVNFSYPLGMTQLTSFIPGINTFKGFLESIAYGDDTALQTSRRAILLQYLRPESTSHADRRPIHASELFQSWSFATQSNNESLYSAITAVLALLLKTISHHVEFQDAGKDLCNLFLQKEHLNLLERGLSAEKSKDHVISPCLRLLTQLVSFDGGYAAKRVYRNKDVTLKRLDTFLSLRQDVKGKDAKSRRKISVRIVALQYLFANLRLQDHATKTEILAHGRLSRSLFQEVKEDPPSVIRELLQVMKDDILKDDKIPRRAKSRFFTDLVLNSIATLYSYNIDKDPKAGEDDQNQENIAELAHAFLLTLCTTPQYGVLLKPEAQHPGLLDEEPIYSTNKFQAVDASSKEFRKRATIQNSTLSSFLQRLRPYASTLQRDLTLATFQAAPELVSDYFHKKKAFSFEPKLTATWLGFAAFLLSTIQMPLHPAMVTSGASVLAPPALFDMIESILPLPLSSKVVSRCLNQNSTMIKFLVIKIMIAAFGKFAQTIRYFRATSRNVHGRSARIWDVAASELVDEFGQRCPDMNHVITVFRSCASGDSLLREACARLLSLYYEHLPQAALEQKFDASVALSAAFDEMSVSGQSSGKPSVKPIVLTHLLDIGRCSPDMRWWQKSGSYDADKFSMRLTDMMVQSTTSCPFLEGVFGSVQYSIRILAVARFRLYSSRPSTRDLVSLTKSIESSKNEEASCVFSSSPSRQNYFLRSPIRQERSPSPIRSWSCGPQEVYAYPDDEGWQPSEALFGFLDDCLIRLTKKTVKYHQDLLGLIAEIKCTYAPGANIMAGEFIMVVLEQWPFVQTSTSMPDVENICHWLMRFLLVLERNDGDLEFIKCVRSKAEALTTLQHCKLWLKNAPEGPSFEGLDFRILQQPRDDTPPLAILEKGYGEQAPKEGWQPPTPPTSESEDHPGLSRWKQLGIEEAVVEGALGELILCLCSQYAEIRQQALMELRGCMKALKSSQYSEREALYLLVGEVVETCKTSVAETVLPNFVGVAAAESCLVLSDPLHFLYTKVNKFLNKGPVWKIEKLPSYWVEQIVMRLPTMDDAYYKEIGWLLNVLIEGLRTSAVSVQPPMAVNFFES
ncbi:MAG: hypothetical protein Q9209_004211 [Squamulea sp. 1 TL-2023]